MKALEADKIGSATSPLNLTKTVSVINERGADLTNAIFEDSAIDSALFDRAILENTSFENAGTYGYSMKKGEIPDW